MGEKFQILSEAIARQGGLGEEAATVLEETLAREGENCRILRLLGKIYRAQGDCDAALNTYTRLLALSPDDSMAAYLCDVFSGRQIPPSLHKRSEFWPAPFVCIDGFLSDSLKAKVLRLALTRERLFARSEISTGIKVSVRSSSTLSQKHLGPIGYPFMEQIKSRLPDVLPQLHCDTVTLDRFELQMAVHLNDNFYAPHQDTGGEKLNTRAVSFVYYFYDSPKPFEGGDLLLYDTKLETNTCTIDFTRVEPVDNRVVFFRSDYFHAVTSVSCRVDGFSQGRFALNGWGHNIDQ